MKYDVVIVGAGIMGTAAAYYLSKAHKKILLFDQFELENDKNASQDYSRVFRYVYAKDAFYTKLTIESLKLWKEIEKTAKTKLYFPCGVFLMGKEKNGYSIQSYKTMKKLNQKVELLEGKRLKSRFPQFAGNAGVLDPYGGILEAKKAVKVFATLAVKNGVIVKTKSKAIRINNQSIVLKNGKRIRADKIIVTAGSWTKKLLGNKIRIIPTKQEVVFFKPKNLKLFSKEYFPVFAHLESGFYGFPIHKGIDAIKIANHFPGNPIDPDNINKKVSKSFIDQCQAFFKKYIPQLEGSTVIKTKICPYDMTKNGDFIIDKISDSIIVGTGFSGHGFKFAPLIGKILADLALKGKTSTIIKRFRLNRFN